MKFDTDAQTRLALQDLWHGVRASQLWLMLGWQDIRQRYRRSMLGPFWLTLSTGVMVIALGFVYAAIFKMPLDRYFPFLAIGMVTWTLIAGLVVEGCQAFIAVEPMIKQIRLPFTMHVCRMIWRNFIIFAHNALIIVAVLLFVGPWPSVGSIALLAPGLALVVVNAIWVGLLFGLLCARFRDVPLIVSSLMQLVFFITPIIWHPSLLPGRQRVINWNPFHHFVEIVRAPLLGEVPAALTWSYVVAVTLFGWLVAFVFLRRYRRRIAYWV